MSLLRSGMFPQCCLLQLMIPNVNKIRTKVVGHRKTHRYEEYKRSIDNAIDDRRVQERCH